jgi:hypothetical protein
VARISFVETINRFPGAFPIFPSGTLKSFGRSCAIATGERTKVTNKKVGIFDIGRG